VRLLLDTHAFLWFILNDRRLSQHARNLISNANNDIEISPASYWEIAIKIGKLRLRSASEIIPLLSRWMVLWREN